MTPEFAARMLKMLVTSQCLHCGARGAASEMAESYWLCPGCVRDPVAVNQARAAVEAAAELGAG